MRINIRCCCTPGLVLGTVDVREALVREGQTVVFPLTDGSILTLTVRLARTITRISPEMRAYADPAMLALLVDRHDELALYSNDTPLETVRQIESFVEINQPVPIGGEP